MAEHNTASSRLTFEVTSQPNQVPCYSLVIGGVLCRWWGKEEPEGAKALEHLLLLMQEGIDVRSYSADTIPLLQTLCTVALNPKVAEYLPYGTVERVKSWLRYSPTREVRRG